MQLNNKVAVITGGNKPDLACANRRRSYRPSANVLQEDDRT
jgi:hypothetical protein